MRPVASEIRFVSPHGRIKVIATPVGRSNSDPDPCQPKPLEDDKSKTANGIVPLLVAIQNRSERPCSRIESALTPSLYFEAIDTEMPILEEEVGPMPGPA